MKKPSKKTRRPGEYLSPPPFVPPQLPAAERKPPRGNGWFHEIKYDGYRLQARIENDNVRLLTRSGLNWTEKFRGVAEELAGLRLKNALFDGEVCVLDDNGVSSFTALQEAITYRRFSSMRYVVFDLIHCDGHDLRAEPLRERKKLLRTLIPPTAVKIRYSDHLESDHIERGKDILAAACALGAEGIVSKRANAPYRSGRNTSWVKAKCITEQEMVVGGYTGNRQLGSLLVGYYENGELHYAGRVGTGFTQKERTLLFDGLGVIKRTTSPFASIPAPYRNAHWVEPRLVASIAFASWTANGRLRHPSYRYLRDDKPPIEVTRERAGTLSDRKRHNPPEFSER